MNLSRWLRRSIRFVRHHMFEQLVHGFLEADDFLDVVGVRH